MAKNSGAQSGSHNGLNDITGSLLVVLAILLFCALFSFDLNDISFLTTRVNKPMHNWIGPIGAWSAYLSFWLAGGAAYLVPWLAGLFAISYLTSRCNYLRERLWWSLLWTFLLLVSITGVLFILDDGGRHGTFHQITGIPSAGGMLGYLTFGQTRNREYGFVLLGRGAWVVYSALGLISLFFLTNFHLGTWLRALVTRRAADPKDEFKSPEEIALEKRARELEKQKRKLEEEVERATRGDKTEKLDKSEKAEKSPSGLGADLQPVPEPTVRDLSVPQAKGPRCARPPCPSKPRRPRPPRKAKSSPPRKYGRLLHR